MLKHRVWDPKEKAYWIADKIHAYGDYAKEAAMILQQQADEIEDLENILLCKMRSQTIKVDKNSLIILELSEEAGDYSQRLAKTLSKKFPPDLGVSVLIAIGQQEIKVGSRPMGCLEPSSNKEIHTPGECSYCNKAVTQIKNAANPTFLECRERYYYPGNDDGTGIYRCRGCKHVINAAWQPKNKTNPRQKTGITRGESPFFVDVG